MKFATRTLGCKMNSLDSARLAAALQLAGHTYLEDEAEADIVFVNSCAVTSRADQQSRQESRKVLKSEKQLAIFGCGPKVEMEKWHAAFPAALIFRDEKSLFKYFGADTEEKELLPLTSRTRLPVAIQTGCDNHCTFCITRVARGKSEDFPLDSIIRQIQRAETAGIKEIVLTGIQLAGWGCVDTEKFPERSRLPELISTILAETEIPRIRLSSLGPQFLTDAFFEVFKNPRVCDHLHLSVQSGSPSVLTKMNRGHGSEEVFAIAERARKTRADVALTADFIVGFPGESEVDFAMTKAMVKKIGFAKLHVFPFSPRAGTGAAKFHDQVPLDEKKRRAKALRELGDTERKAFITAQIGKQKSVLSEDGNTGLTPNYIRVLFPVRKKPGEIVFVVLTPENTAYEGGE